MPETNEPPIYSADPAEEARMLEIRDHPADRTRLIAKSRVLLGRMQPPFHNTELQWILEDRNQFAIPLLEPREYDVLIRKLAETCLFLRRQNACMNEAIKDLESRK